MKGKMLHATTVLGGGDGATTGTVMKIGSCSDPLDVTLVRSYFEVQAVPVVVTSRLDIEAKAPDAANARDCLRQLRGYNPGIEVTLEAAGCYDYLEALPTPPARTKPFDTARHQAQPSKISAKPAELVLDNSGIESALEAAGLYDRLDSLPAPPSRTKPFDTSRHQAPASKIKAGRPETIELALRHRRD